MLERHANERPKQEALVTPKRRVTYEDLYLRARSAASTMHSLGVGRGDHVGILMGNDEKWLSLFYGAA
ncbi:MAG TPA: AMP-binding protein, partial [Burkholderiales bacterium]|nr:AMP-binding protein [Burkholderiales bacterium]